LNDPKKGGESVKPGLFVLDVQNRFFEMGETTRKSLEAAVPYIQGALQLFRNRGLPVFWVQHEIRENESEEETRGFALPNFFQTLPEDVRIVKKTGSMFLETPLAQILHQREVDTLIITGFSAEHCVLASIMAATDLGFFPVILRGALASGSPENIPFVERIQNIVSFDVLARFLENC